MKRGTTIWGRLSGVRAGLGRASVVCVSDGAELVEAIRESAETERRLLPLGNGTNLVGADEDIHVACLKLTGEELCGFRVEGQHASIGCGERLSAMIRRLCRLGFGGMAPLVGIPGTVGAALCGNAGANGHSVFEYVLNAEGISLQDGTPWEWQERDGGWSYRCSPVPRNVVVTRAVLKLAPCDIEVEKQMQALELERRKTVTPHYPTLGSTFKNPSTGPSAGRLLDDAGCKELSCGAFKVFERHANWIINVSGTIGAAKDYRKLVSLMKARVFEHCGVMLQEEVRVAEDAAAQA